MLTVFLHADFCIFINLRHLQRLCLFSLFASFKIYIFLSFIQLLHNLKELNNWLVFVVFFFYLQLSSFFHCAVLFVACEEIIRFLVFELLFRLRPFAFISQCFLKC